jgi:hypothetical protein
MTATDEAGALLALSDQILDGKVAVPGGRATRAAAVVARQALETLVHRATDELVPGMFRPSMRSRLILLRELGDSEKGRIAKLAWDGLSRACHHHAYELQPSEMEVRALVEMVQTFMSHRARP